MKLTFLFDGEMSVWVRTDEGVILFDTDSTPENLAAHASKLGFSLSDVDAVVLSHGHLDHTGGLQAMLDVKPNVPVHFAPGMLTAPYSIVPDGPPEFIGTPLLHEGGSLPAGVTTFTGKREILPNCLALNGALGPVETKFRQKKDGEFVVHRYQDESWLVLGKPGRRTMLVGCSHPGIATMLRFCHEQYDMKDIRTVVGGLHTYDRTEQEMHTIAKTLRDLGIERTFIGHCSGKVAQKAFRDEFKDNATDMAMGLEIEV